MDDDAAAALLIRLLRADGHDVWVPQENGVAGLVDPHHFARAIADARAVLTFNYDDFKDLHLLIQAAGGRHAGLVVVRKDNDSTRDLSARGIANAVRKLEISGQSIENEYHILNHWR